MLLKTVILNTKKAPKYVNVSRYLNIYRALPLNIVNKKSHHSITAVVVRSCL